MNQSSVRIQNAKRNMISGMCQKIVAILFPFITRTVLIRDLGAEYAGVGGLFTSILQVMNVAELGFSSAVAFGLYKPIADHDTKYVCRMLSFYRRVYKWIGMFVLATGIIIMPILKYLVKGSYPQNLNIYILFMLQVIYTVIGYLAYAYKEVIISATQRQDILSKVDIVVTVLQGTVQILVLIFFRNYYFYVITMIFCMLGRSLYIGKLTTRIYPEYRCEGKLTKEERQVITKHVKGLAIGRINVVSRNAFDSIVIAKFCGLIDVTIYENYYYIMNGIIALLSVITVSITAGVGNSVATESRQKNCNDYFKFEYYFWMISAWCTVCLACLYQPLMNLWVGEKLTAQNGIMLLFVVYFYISQMGKIRSVYANAAGIWWKLRKISFMEMCINLFLNFVLGWKFGMRGILWATIITVMIFSVVSVTNVLFKEYFKKNALEIHKEFLEQGIVTVLIVAITYFICSFIEEGYRGFVIKLIVCMVVPSCLLIGISMCRKSTRTYIREFYKNYF